MFFGHFQNGTLVTWKLKEKLSAIKQMVILGELQFKTIHKNQRALDLATAKSSLCLVRNFTSATFRRVLKAIKRLLAQSWGTNLRNRSKSKNCLPCSYKLRNWRF